MGRLRTEREEQNRCDEVESEEMIERMRKG